MRLWHFKEVHINLQDVPASGKKGARVKSHIYIYIYMGLIVSLNNFDGFRWEMVGVD